MPVVGKLGKYHLIQTVDLTGWDVLYIITLN